MQTIQFGARAINARHVEQFHIRTVEQFQGPSKRQLVFRSVIGVPGQENGDIILLIDLEAKTDAESLISNTCNLLAKYKRINFYFDPDSGTDQVEALDEDA